MSKDENNESTFLNKKDAQKKALGLNQLTAGMFFKYLEEAGFPIDYY